MGITKLVFIKFLEIIDPNKNSVAKLSLLVSIFTAYFVYSQNEDQENARILRAWSFINQAQETRGNVGQITAMETLAREGVSMENLNYGCIRLERPDDDRSSHPRLTPLDRVDTREKGNCVILNRAALEKANLAQSRFSGVAFYDAKLSEADLSQTDLTKTHFNRADLEQADLSFSQAQYASFEYAKAKGARFTGANLCFASFLHADLKGADLRGAFLGKTLFYGVESLADADFTLAKLVGTMFGSPPPPGLKPEQLLRACIDPLNPPVLPEGWPMPEPCLDIVAHRSFAEAELTETLMCQGLRVQGSP